jgi:hypothetical protein
LRVARKRAAPTEAPVEDRPQTAPDAVSIDPPTNELTLAPGDTLDETIVVTVPKGKKFKNVSLVASASIAPVVDSIDPPGGYGPITGKQDESLVFIVHFHGVPCLPEPQVFTGTLDVIADGKVVAQKDVKINVPACPSTFVYSAKFICGEQPSCGCECSPVQPGRYATEINIHNVGLEEVKIQKRFMPVVLLGAPVGREPQAAAAGAEDELVLPAQAATMDDCCRIGELLFGGDPATPLPITIGFVEFTSSAPIAVTAVYTARGLESSGVSIDVEQIVPRRR